MRAEDEAERTGSEAPREIAGARSPWLAPGLGVAAAIALVGLACVLRPGATALAVGTSAPVAVPVIEASAPLSQAEVEALELGGVRGGRLTFEVAGDPEDVLEMLLDFEHAEGNRAWAQHYELLQRDGDVVTARWSFQGRMGIDPRPEMELRIERLPDEIVVSYRLSKPAFGLAAFFGEYRIRPAAAPHASILTERVNIDSGIPYRERLSEGHRRRPDGRRPPDRRLDGGPDGRLPRLSGRHARPRLAAALTRRARREHPRPRRDYSFSSGVPSAEKKSARARSCSSVGDSTSRTWPSTRS